MAGRRRPAGHAPSRGYHGGDVETVISVDDVQREAEAIRNDRRVIDAYLGAH